LANFEALKAAEKLKAEQEALINPIQAAARNIEIAA
jgi:hypothetical protein